MIFLIMGSSILDTAVRRSLSFASDTPAHAVAAVPQTGAEWRLKRKRDSRFRLVSAAEHRCSAETLSGAEGVSAGQQPLANVGYTDRVD
jgi:hypothetical protein